MPLNLINDKMILKNKVEMQPKIEYVLAPNNNLNNIYNNSILEKLQIEEFGEFGAIDAKSIKFNIDESVQDSKKRSYTVDQRQSDSLSVNSGFNIDTPNLIVDNSESFKFGVEKVNQSYIVDDPSFYKKKSVKNLYEYYRRNMEKGVINPHWGFTNFNCISFFTIPTDSVGDNIRQYSHMNGLFYPNRMKTNDNGTKKYAYDFLKDDKTTISFWINPRQQNIVINEDRVCYMNPGCILHIPGFISVYMLPGDEVDFNYKVKSFNICVVLGLSTLKSDIYEMAVLNNNPLTLESSGRLNDNILGEKHGDYAYFTKKNVLKYNNWHNVVIKLKKEESSENKDTWRLLVFVDNIQCCNQIFEDNFSNLENDQEDYDENGIINSRSYITKLKLKQLFKNNNGFISIGNRFSNLWDEKSTQDDSNKIKIEEAFKTLFSKNKSQSNDLLGPYIEKHISFGKSFSDEDLEAEVPEDFSDANQNNSYNLFLGSSVVVFTTDERDLWVKSPKNFIVRPSIDAYNTTSYALNADIYDIRIYNDFVENIEDIIYKKNITDFTDEKLVFAVPVLYYDQTIKKKSIYNMSGATFNETNTHLANINLVNTAYRGPINSYFSDKCLGHEVAVDNFVVEFKQKVSPNIVFGNDFNSDLNIYKYLSKLFSENADVLDLKEGKDLLGFLYKNNKKDKILNRDILDVPNDLHNQFDDDEAKSSLFTSIANFVYKNNFIMPCDNGIQNIDYNIKGYYEENETIRNIHSKQNEEDLRFINLENIFDESIAYRQNNNLITSCAITSLVNRSESSLSVVPESERASFTIGENKKAASSYDKFKNISLRNYHRLDYNIEDDDNIMFKYLDLDNSNLTTGLNSFFKDKCNPLSRVINHSTNNCIDRFSAPASVKKINQDEFIPYYRLEMPFSKIYKSFNENYSKVFCISTQVFGKKIKKDTFEMYDPSLGGTYGQFEIKLRDNKKGGLYRADCETPHATWNTVGHCLYSEGMATVLHPSLENFGRDTIKISFSSSNTLNVFELNLPAHSGETNFSRNTSYDENLRHNESAFNSDESFVYITDIHLHDENLNIIAKAKLAKPFAKKSSDNVLFRLKLDY